MIGGIAFAFAHSIFLIQFILSFLHHQAFYKMFQHLVDKIEHSNDDYDAERKQFLKQLIRFHMMAGE